MRADRQRRAREILEVLERGWYEFQGRRVDIGHAIQYACDETELIRPEEWPAIETTARELASSAQRGAVNLTEETTLEAAHRLAVGEGRERIGILNFASARVPGGGFLAGAQAQEESLARASSLYACLLRAPMYYAANLAESSPYATEHAIYSESVPFFADEVGEHLPAPYLASVVTMPAVEAAALDSHTADMERVSRTMRARALNVLALFSSRGCRHVILGAWGCGVFGNDPALIADAFHSALEAFGRNFASILFAVYDRSDTLNCLKAFERRFGRLRGELGGK